MCLLPFIGFLVAAAVAGVMLLCLAQTVVGRNRGRCYDNLMEIPANRVGLLLGCTRYLKSGRPNLYFSYRIAAAAALFHAGKVRLLLASGASLEVGVNEAATMQEALVEAGVPADCIVCDPHGYRTIDSVLRAHLIYGQDRLTIVSQPFHNHRALYIAERRGIDAVGFNAQDVPEGSGRAVRLREVFARARVLIDIHVSHTRARVMGKRSPL